MPTFQYAPYRNPFVSSISDLIQAPGSIEAQRAEAVGNAQARAAQQSGAAWSGAAQNIGQDVSRAIDAYQQQRLNAPLRAAQLADIKSQGAERDSITAQRNAETQAKQQLAQDAPQIAHILSTAGNKQDILDSLKGTQDERLIPQVEASFDAAAKRKADFDKTVAETNKSNADADESLLKIQNAHADYLGGIAADVAKHDYNPVAFFHGVALANKDGMIDTQTAGQAIALGIQSPNQIKAFVDARIAASPEQAKLADARAKQAAIDADKSADNARLQAAATETARHNQAMEARPGGGASGANGRLLTDSDADYVGTQYRILGAGGIPTRVGEADRAAIIHAANEQVQALGQSPVQAVQRQAAFKADGASLTKMTNMKEAASSYESKALAQADIVDGLSDKVGRTTSPLLNRALLAGKADVIGDADTQLLFNGIQTFANEYAKIMEGSTGSAAASSDSARAAASRLINASLNKDTLRKTTALMRREMDLTIKGYDATIEHITERMGGSQPPPVMPPPPAGSVIPQGVKIQR